MITAFIARMTPACKDITHVASQSLDRSLPWSTRLKLQLHYRICEACARYRDQLRVVRQALRRSTGQDHADKSSSSAPADKTRLTEAFRAKHQ
jgi:hypothetical protein